MASRSYFCRIILKSYHWPEWQTLVEKHGSISLVHFIPLLFCYPRDIAESNPWSISIEFPSNEKDVKVDFAGFRFWANIARALEEHGGAPKRAPS